MTVTLPEGRTAPEAGLLSKKTLIYGRYKVGKSTLVNDLDEKVLFLATEPGLSAIDAYKIDVRSWADFLEAAKLLRDGKHGYNLVAIDTVDELARYCAEHVTQGLAGSAKLDTSKFIHASDFDYGKGWDAIASEFRSKVAKFCSLGFGVVFVSHAKESTVKTRTGLEISTVAPDVGQKGMRKWLLGFVDYIFYATILTTPEGEQRVLQCQPSEGVEAGARIAEGATALPEFIGLDAAELRTVLGDPPEQNGTSAKESKAA